MSHHFTFKVTVETERESGHFASREEQAEQIRDEIEASSPGYLSGLGSWGDGEYVINDFQVEDDDSDERIKKLRDRIRNLEKEIKYLAHGE